MSTAGDRPRAARHEASLRWLAVGIAAGALAGAGALAHAVPAGTLLDYPAADAVLRSAGRVPGTLGSLGALALVAGAAWAWRSARMVEFAAGALASAWLAIAFGGWARLEAHESDLERQELATIQELALRPIAGAIEASIAALRVLGPSTGPTDAPWQAAAQRLVDTTPEARAVAWIDAAGNTLGAGPESAQVADIVNGVPGNARTDRPWAASAWPTGSGLADARTRVIVAAPAGAQGTAILLLDAQGLAAHAECPPAAGAVLSLTLAGAGTDDAAEPPLPEGLTERPGLQPSALLRTAGLAWRSRAFPTEQRMNDRHQRGNTTVLAFGWLGAIACVAGGIAIRRAADARSDAADKAHRLAAATARARITALGREALSAEAGHVIRARLRETLRTLESADEPASTAATRAAAVARACESLSMAEAEVGALLDRPGHTRIERAETDAALEHLYSHTVLEVAGCAAVPVSTPVPAGALAEAQRRLGSATFAVLSSDNPMSVDLGARANQLRRGVLALELRSAGHAHVPAVGRSDDGRWAEHGFAVAVTPHEADAIAELHEQRAYFWFDGERFFIHEVVGARRTIALPRIA